MEIRGATIKYSSNKKRMKTEHLKLLLHDLEQKELELNIDRDNSAEILAHIDLDH